MKSIIIYFSLTGSTEKIARALQKGIQQVTGQCDILPIKEAAPKRLKEYDLIGFGNPIMGRKISMNVQNFVKSMRFVGGKHIFLFCTSHSLVDQFAELADLIKERGLITIGWKSWLGSVYGPLGDPTPSASDGHPDKIDLDEAEAFAREMVWLSQSIYAGNSNLIPQDPTPCPPPFNEPPELVGSDKDSQENLMKRVHFRLIYDEGKCLYPGCRLCMDNCPVDGIDLTVKPRIIGKPCMTCMHCDQICPTGAIYCDEEQMEWQFSIEKEGANYALQHEQRKKKQGLRQYVPDELVIEGFKNQVYREYNKHPRFVIGKGRIHGKDPMSWSENST